MPKHSITREMHYSARQLFDIAADVDNYRKFVPLVKVSRSYDVRSGEAGTKLFKGELVIRYPKLGIEERVISDVVADPGRLIVSSRDSWPARNAARSAPLKRIIIVRASVAIQLAHDPSLEILALQSIGQDVRLPQNRGQRYPGVEDIPLNLLQHRHGCPPSSTLELS